MVTKNNTKKRNQIHSSIRQTIWNYMRRNRVFRFGDVMAITGVNYKYLRNMLMILKNANYVEIVKKEKPFTSTTFKLIKCTGVKAPSMNRDRSIIYDYNTKEEIVAKATPSIVKVLNIMTKAKMTKAEIFRLSGVGEATLVKCFAKLTPLGVIQRVVPTEKIDNEKLFHINPEKLQQLKQDIVDGAIEMKGYLDQKQ